MWITPARSVKGEAKDGDGLITIKVQDLNRFRVHYTMRMTDQLQSLFDFYYRSMPGVDRNTGRFFVDGKRMKGWQTPADFNMEDGDEVDFFVELLGGARRTA
ncbi:hypothetical protein BRADI_1g23832v3 [Brachypodium distachyon]|uniref:Ubiquitin-like domain-containing protein n=2 Tax=Brachypodium distachyon TaxID=15368 RepID=A0A0Q3NE89_BRADI|nr:hypothetical protein BRADI_1g23832v3 [Brachypodium distachyon]